jgi:hypothetical protein
MLKAIHASEDIVAARENACKGWKPTADRENARASAAESLRAIA